MVNKVPRNWVHFVEECNLEIEEITTGKYEGGMSKGVKHGMGSFIYPDGTIFKGSFRND